MVYCINCNKYFAEDTKLKNCPFCNGQLKNNKSTFNKVKKWKLVKEVEENETLWSVEYNKEYNVYRVSLFNNYHFVDEIIFAPIEKGDKYDK